MASVHPCSSEQSGPGTLQNTAWPAAGASLLLAVGLGIILLAAASSTLSSGGCCQASPGSPDPPDLDVLTGL